MTIKWSPWISKCQYQSCVDAFKSQFMGFLSPVTMLPAPDLAKQTNKEQDENLQVQENKPSLKTQGRLASSHPRRRNYQRVCQTLIRTRKWTTPRMVTPWKRFSPKSFLKKTKMVLRSVQSEWINFTNICIGAKGLGAQSCRGDAKDDNAFSLNLLLDLAVCRATKIRWKSDQRQTW